MTRQTMKAISWGLAVALYLRFGLEPTGWLFYEASHSLGVDWLYWGYSAFRGGGYAFGLWPHRTLACIALGVVVMLLSIWRGHNRKAG